MHIVKDPIFSVVEDYLVVEVAVGDEGTKRTERISLGDGLFKDELQPKYSCVSIEERCLEAKINVQQKRVDNNDDALFTKLQLSDVCNIFCRVCGSCFVTEDQQHGSIARLLPMPSPFWLELSDMWMCTCKHTEHDKHEHENGHHPSHKFKQFPLQEIRAVKDACLDGETFLMFHSANTVQLSLTMHLKDSDKYSVFHKSTFAQSKSEVTFWSSVFCAKCLHCVGTAEVPPAVKSDPKYWTFSDDSITTIKFNKADISTNKSHIPELNALREHTLETSCAFEIYQASQAHSCYRFLICNTDTRETAIQLLLVNWDTKINTNAFGSVTKLSPVLKVSFRDCRQQTDEQKELIRKWKESRLEVMYMSEANCTELLRILQQSNSVFPVQRQTLNKMNVGFLRRVC